MLGPLQNNGGLTLTHALSANNLAIDAGNNVANLDFDQRGPAFLRVSNDVPDIGAFELQPAPDINACASAMPSSRRSTTGYSPPYGNVER